MNNCLPGTHSKGEYRINYLGLVRCDSIPNKIVPNLYLSKKSANTTEIKGNITNYIPFDDSLSLELNLAVKDSIGGWKENGFILKKSKACSAFKEMLGNAWNKVTEGAGLYNATCPFSKGYYNVTGIDTNVFTSINVPKTYFYGVYKLRLTITKINEVYCCFILILDIKRPWETD
uniref:MD-2-related lipid-recognition domain-containing protein n=1 Tax=Schizaphis graminum TaxID=13262 RepID=A0A2S2NM47_SCHGA